MRTHAPGEMPKERRKGQSDTGRWTEVIQAAERLLELSSRGIEERVPKVGFG